MEKLYTATVTATGGRAHGHVESADKLVNFDLRFPKALGGANDDYLNPELLFAAGYSACFDSALNVVLSTEKIRTSGTTITAHVTIGKPDPANFQLAVDLEITIPGVEKSVAEDLVKKAHQICPYSKATRNNIEVNLIVK